MVKRPKTPEANEEAKYYTCWSPYPNNADFELSRHYITFCRWIANILEDSSALHSLYYKPKHGMIIFAVANTYSRPERLLGEHRWSEFLKKPGYDERTLVSKIFYSTYSTDREVQKDGWKCIFVEDYFFLNWGMDKWFTKVPYPPPHWCDVPSENRVHKALCRPLPVAYVPRPGPSAPPPRPVVGSADWAQTRASTTTNSQRAAGRGNAPSTSKGAKANKPAITTKSTLGQDSFPALDSKPPAPKKIIPGLSPSTVPPAQSAWGNRPSESAPAPSSHRSALSPPANSTAHQVWANNRPSTSQAAASSSTSTNPPSGSGNTLRAKTKNEKSKAAPKPSPVATTTNGKKRKNATTSSSHPGKFKYSSSSSSSSQSEHSDTASPPSSAPSSPSLSAVSLASGPVSGSVQIDPSEYDNDSDYDEELTEETYHENWETASTYVPPENNAIAVRIGSNDKGKGTSKTKTGPADVWPEDNPRPSSSAPVDLWARPEPVKQEPMTNLWADAKPNLRPTGRASAMEARAKTEKEVLCPLHKGKCPRGICEVYKKEKRRVDKLQRKYERQNQSVEEGEEVKEESGSGSKKGSKKKSKKVVQERPEEKKQLKEEDGSGEKKESKKEPKKVVQERPEEKEQLKEGSGPGEKKESKKEPKKVVQEKPEEKKQSKESNKADEIPVEDTVVTPTPSPPPSNGQDNKKMWADYDVDGDSDIGDVPDFGEGKMFYADEDFEPHED